MRALTFWQPWLWAMQHAGKRIENREWTPPAGLRKGENWFALHAGLRVDPNAARIIERITGKKAPEDLTRGAVVGIARIDGPIWERSSQRVLAYNGETPRTEIDPKEQAQWFFGYFGWPLECRWLDQPIECKGRQRFWNLPWDVERELAVRFPELKGPGRR